ncbi:MAG TPA: S1 family peptidase [bacterium]|nr:S1 family peptidase [bacterium]
MVRTTLAVILFLFSTMLGAFEQPGVNGLNEIEQWLMERGIPVLSLSEKVPMITNGTETGYTQFRGVVGLVMTVTQGGVTGQGACTATLIDPEVLLTAGHCVYLRENYQLVLDGPADPSKVVVRNGANMFAGDPLANAQTIKKHETWTGNISSWGENVDMAVIHLDRKIYHLAPYGIRNDPAEVVGDEGKIVGYGITASDAFDSGIHRMGDSKILKLKPYGKNILEIGNPSGSCQGDSGGPFLTTQNDAYVVSGITSFGGQTCYPTYGNYYTYVLPYRDWINAAVEEFTGHGLIETLACGDDDDECGPGDELDCATLGEEYVPGIMAPCHEGCWGYDLTVCQEKPPVCGDEKVKSPEICDSNTIDCASLGQYKSGTAAPCNDTCDGWDDSGCEETVCGDGKKEGNEFCDGNATDCSTLGDYAEGTEAPCKDDCTYFDTTPCQPPVTDTAIPDGNDMNPDGTPVTDETAVADTEENPDSVVVPDTGTAPRSGGSGGCALTMI